MTATSACLGALMIWLLALVLPLKAEDYSFEEACQGSVSPG